MRITTTLILLFLALPLPSQAERPSITALQQQINQLSAEMNRLKSLPHYATEVYDGDNKLIGVSVPVTQWPVPVFNSIFVYNTAADLFVPFTHQLTVDGIERYLPKTIDIVYESFDCTGQAFTKPGLLQNFNATKDVLFTNNSLDIRFYKTAGLSAVENRTYSFNSEKKASDGVCEATSETLDSHRIVPLTQIDNPLLYSLPVRDPFRIQYVGE